MYLHVRNGGAQGRIPQKLELFVNEFRNFDVLENNKRFGPAENEGKDQSQGWKND